MAGPADVSKESRASAALQILAGQYLTFDLSGERYGIPVLKIREIIQMMDVTRVPRTPSFVRGVVNLRGKVIPVIDARLVFGLESAADTQATCVIVTEVRRGDHDLVLGMIVDQVTEVTDIAAAAIEPAPDLGAQINTEFISGMGKVEKHVVILLDVDRVLALEEIALVDEVASDA